MAGVRKAEEKGACPRVLMESDHRFPSWTEKGVDFFFFFYGSEESTITPSSIFQNTFLLACLFIILLNFRKNMESFTTSLLCGNVKDFLSLPALKSLMCKPPPLSEPSPPCPQQMRCVFGLLPLLWRKSQWLRLVRIFSISRTIFFF